MTNRSREIGREGHERGREGKRYRLRKTVKDRQQLERERQRESE